MLLALVLLLSMATGAFAAQQALCVEIDGEAVAFTADSGVPFVDENGRTQVPLRAVMEKYGCAVTWDAAKQAAVLTKDGTTVIVPVGKSYITVNGARVATDTAAQVKNGRTYLPIRAVLEAFGAEVTWENGKVGVRSGAAAAGAGFENIYVDKDGNLIFALANGTKLNAGQVGKSGKNGRDGDDGRDGVSVTDAYVDGSGNLMIALSSGRVINAGNVTSGSGGAGSLTFADYPVGTKFYLTQPTGAFSVTVKVGGTDYTVKLESIYYELTGKYSASDAQAWVYADGRTTFKPYDVTVHVDGETDTALAGQKLTVTFDPQDSSSWGYTATVGADGSFSVATTQGENGTAPWNEPKTLMLRSVIVEKTASGGGSSSGGTSDADIQAAIAKAVGTWEIPGEPDKTIVVSADGTLTMDGITHTPKYYTTEPNTYLVAQGSCNVEFYFDSNYAYIPGGLIWGYYRSGSYDTITLTKDNFLDYYEYKEIPDIEYNSFGEFVRADVEYVYALKEEYRDTLIGKSSAAVRAKVDWYTREYSIDLENETITTVKPGTFSKTETVTNRNNYASWVIEELELNTHYFSYLHAETGTATFADVEVVEATGTLYLLKD